MKVKAVYENQVLRPLEKLDLKEGDEVQIVVKKNIADGFAVAALQARFIFQDWEGL